MPDERSAGSTLRLEPDLEGTTPVLNVRDPGMDDGRPDHGRISIFIAGDVWCPHDEHLATEPERVPWAALAPFVNSHDVSIANLEAPISDALADDPKSGPSLRSHRRTAAALRAGGFSVVSLANNHLRDAGDRGVLDTLAACDDAGLHRVGGGADAREALEPSVLEIEGFTLGIIAVAEREFSIAGPRRPGAAPLEPYATPERVRSLRARTDAVIVVLHGGNEYYSLPSPRLKAIAHALAASGASAVVCHHQHVYGGVEVTGGTAIAYGTGNFYFPPRFSRDPRWRRGYGVSLTVGEGGVGRFRLLPFRQSDPSPEVAPLTEPEARDVCADVLSLSRTIAADERLSSAWSRFCAGQRARYLTRILGLTRLERAALERGVWPSWRLRRAELPSLLNLLTCEAHRETLVDVLQGEMAAFEADETGRHRR